MSNDATTVASAQERFTQAALRDDLPTIRNLLESGSLGAIPKNAGAKALFIAEGKNDSHTVRLLLAAGVNPSDSAEGLHCALYMAVVHGHYDIMRLLLEAGADPNGPPRDAPLLTAARGNAQALEMLLAAGARIDVATEHGANALHLAAEFGQTDIVRRLLQAGIPANSPDPHGYTAMHHAARSARSSDVIPVLLENGADIDARTNEGMTPALYAATRGAVRSFDALVRFGADPLARSTKGGNAFAHAMHSLFSEKGEMVLHILQHYPTLAPQGEELDKALVEAVRRGHITLVEKLADLGADLGQKPGGRTLLQIAPRDAQEVKRLLRALKTGGLIASAMGCEPSAGQSPSASPIL